MRLLISIVLNRVGNRRGRGRGRGFQRENYKNGNVEKCANSLWYFIELLHIKVRLAIDVNLVIVFVSSPLSHSKKPM